MMRVRGVAIPFLPNPHLSGPFRRDVAPLRLSPGAGQEKTMNLQTISWILQILQPVGWIVRDVVADRVDRSIPAKNMFAESGLPGKIPRGGLMASACNPGLVGTHDGREGSCQGWREAWTADDRWLKMDF